jgi:flagellar hook-length control protein FliK
MQTELQLFDSSIFGASGKGLATVVGSGKPTKEAASDELAGFMEIMSALLALPPEQWKQSLAELNTMSADGAEADLPSPVANNGQQMPTADLLNLIMNMKGAVLQQLQAAKADGKAEPLLDMAEALLEDPQIAAFASQDADQTHPVQEADPEALFSQVKKAFQDGLPAEPGQDKKDQPFPDVMQGTQKGVKSLTPEAAMKDGNQSPAVQKEEALKASRHPKQLTDFLFKTSDGQKEDSPAPDTDKIKPSLEAGIAKAPTQDNMPDEKGQQHPVGGAHQTLTAESVKNAGVNAQPQVNGEVLEDRFAQKTDSSVNGSQGLLARSGAGRESNGQNVSGVKEMMPQDKAASSDVIRQIVQRMSMQTTGDQSKMVIRLKPEFLGNVHLHVLTENHQVTVRMMADSTLVKDIVEQNLPHLTAELQHHGLVIQKFDVFVANDGQGWRGGQEQAGFNDTRNQRQSRSGGEKSRPKRGKIAFDTGSGKKIIQKNPGEVDYFA